MADNKQPATRIFTKKVGDETRRRTVTSPQAEIAARFDGYEEDPAATAAAAKSSGSGSRSSGTASSSS
jgi:hypothetical protein